MIYLLTAIGLTPGGSSTVHIYRQTIHRTTQSTKTIHRTTQFKTIHRTTQFKTIQRTTQFKTIHRRTQLSYKYRRYQSWSCAVTWCVVALHTGYILPDFDTPLFTSPKALGSPRWALALRFEDSYFISISLMPLHATFLATPILFN